MKIPGKSLGQEHEHPCSWRELGVVRENESQGGCAWEKAQRVVHAEVRKGGLKLLHHLDFIWRVVKSAWASGNFSVDKGQGFAVKGVWLLSGNQIAQGMTEVAARRVCTYREGSLNWGGRKRRWSHVNVVSMFGGRADRNFDEWHGMGMTSFEKWLVNWSITTT